MKKYTPAAAALLNALAAGAGHYATHPSTRAALIERGFAQIGANGRLEITDAGRRETEKSVTDGAVKAQ